MKPDDRLGSWKEIGAYLQRDARTARRWEKEERLPVHRHSHKSRSSVYAYASEIDAWRAGRRVVAEPAPVRVFWRWPALAATILLCLVMVGNGVRPVSAQQAKQTARQVWTTTEPIASASFPSVSPDGRYLGFTSWQAGGALAVRDLAKGTTRLLTPDNAAGKPGVAFEKAFSADSRQLAYLWYSNPREGEVRVIPLDGGAPRTIRKSSGDDYLGIRGWTPDGKQLLAVHSLSDQTSRIVMISVQDGSIHPLKSLGGQYTTASLSPDGRYVAYASTDGKAAPDIFVLSTDGSRENAVVQNPANDFAPVWSPDGSRIVFLSDRTGSYSLWSVPVEEGKHKGPAELVKPDMGRATLLGVSRTRALHYVVNGGGANIYTADLSTGMKADKAPVLATERFVNSNVGPAWSPDGEQLAYYSFRLTSVALVVRTLKSGEDREVPVNFVPELFSAYGNSGPKWFPDGRSLLVAGREPQRPFPSFYRVDLASGKAEMLYHLNREIQVFAFAPDASAIFCSALGLILRVDLATRQETELMKASIVGLSVSPDSKQLAYLSANLTGNASSLGIVPAAGGEPREILRDAPWGDHNKWNALTWSPDGKYLIFVRARSGPLDAPAALVRLPVTGGQPEPLGISLKGEIHNPSVRPDGRQIVFGSTDDTPSEVWALENFLKRGR